MTRAARQPETHRARRPAFTLTELLVSVAILVIAMLAVSYIFTSVSKTSGIATAAIEVNHSIEVLRQTMQADLDAMAPGLLIIDSPDPELVGLSPAWDPREPNYVPDAIDDPPPLIYEDNFAYAPRRDRLTFFTRTSPGTYESWVLRDVTSGEAVITYAHGATEFQVVGTGLQAIVLQRLIPIAYERTLQRRQILLGGTTTLDPDVVADQFPLDINEALAGSFYIGARDTVQETLSELLLRLKDPARDVTTTIDMLYARSVAWENTAPAYADYFVPLILRNDEPIQPYWHDRLKYMNEFLRHVGSFRVEWTDGTTDLGTGQLLWYGLTRRVDFDGDGLEDVAPKSPWPPPTESPEEDRYIINDKDHPGYRAVWRVDNDTWKLRPKALRVTVRLYDSNKRLRDENDRLGQERSFVLDVP